MGVIVWNEEQESASSCLTFDKNGVQTKWLEIFNRVKMPFHLPFAIVSL